MAESAFGASASTAGSALIRSSQRNCENKSEPLLQPPLGIKPPLVEKHGLWAPEQEELPRLPGNLQLVPGLLITSVNGLQIFERCTTHKRWLISPRKLSTRIALFQIHTIQTVQTLGVSHTLTIVPRNNTAVGMPSDEGHCVLRKHLVGGKPTECASTSRTDVTGIMDLVKPRHGSWVRSFANPVPPQTILGQTSWCAFFHP